MITRWPQEQESSASWRRSARLRHVRRFRQDPASRRGGLVFFDDGFDVMPWACFYWKANGSRTNGQRRQKSAARFMIRVWGNTSFHPTFGLGLLTMRCCSVTCPKRSFTSRLASASLCCSSCFGALPVRKRWIILGGAALVTGLLTVLIVLVSSHVVCALCPSRLGIRREGDRLFVQYDLRLSPVTGKFITPAAAKALPHITGELLPESETRFFGRTTGMPVTFSRDDRGKVTRVTAHFLGDDFLS